MNERHKSMCLLSLTLCTQSYSGSKCSPCLAYEELVQTLKYNSVQFFIDWQVDPKCKYW